ncbi:hypothetical protein B9Z55_003672 [Caenorhabditis nigoni]|uniref:Sdz-33 F-box domain-containing protein n=1 Tax=Caenorhabditis nigoni TaxID=1611254 RepID=A0A2G5VRZ9_9PELO|nr:hypothetical protein B9Z55_003672 [Caenorhabditis nigoni]
MTSTPLNRTGISLFNLPYLVQNEIYANWDLMEIKEPFLMHLSPFFKKYQIELCTGRKDENEKERIWRLHFVPFTGCERLYKGNFYYPVFLKNSCENFVFLVEHLKDVFEVKFGTLELCIGVEIDDVKMKPYVEWMNDFNWESGKVPALSVIARDEPSLKFLLKNLKRDVDQMKIDTYIRKENPASKSGGNPKCSTPVNFKVDVLTGNGEEWWATETMKSMDAIRMDFYQSDLSNLDMNQFLRSWKEGASNERLKEIKLPLRERVKWRTMLEGLDADLRDFRTARKIFRFAKDNQLYQLHGGFDITRADGRIATIGHELYNLIFENQPMEQYKIEECTRISRVWNLEQGDEEEEIEDVIVLEEADGHVADWRKYQRKQGRRHIFMIVW